MVPRAAWATCDFHLYERGETGPIQEAANMAVGIALRGFTRENHEGKFNFVPLCFFVNRPVRCHLVKSECFSRGTVTNNENRLAISVIFVILFSVCYAVL